MKFTKEFLQKMEGDTVSDIMVGHSRWSVSHERIFKHEGRFFKTYYSVGATESQHEVPYEYERPEVECQEMRLVEKTVTVYENI